MGPALARRLPNMPVLMPLPDRIRSFWIETAPLPSFPSLADDHETEIAIVGGGITGLTAAVILARAGLRVTLIEAQKLAQGVTGYTTAHLTEAIDTRFKTLKRDFGKEGAALAAQASRASIERIAGFVSELGIDCRFRRLPGWLYGETEQDLETLHEEYEAAKEAGLSVSMSREVPLPFPTAVGIRFEDQAEFHVREYLAALVDELVKLGGRIHEDSRVRDVEDGSPCRVQLENGREVRARRVIMATNAPLHRFRYQTRLSHYRSYVLGVNVRQPKLDGLFWDTADPYHYLRSDPATGLLIVGGEDHKTGTEEHTQERFERLRDYTAERFSIEDIAFHWAGQVVETADGLPFIGRAGKDSNVLVATGFSGNGMTFGTVAAMLLSELARDRTSPWAELFDPERTKPLAAGPSIAAFNAEVAYHFVADAVRPAETSDLAEIAPGQGKIVRVGARRLAVFRAEDGKLEACSSVCPHLGCHVHFNDAERTWDCPCHGSRFDTKGTVLNGPAARGLERVELSPADGS